MTRIAFIALAATLAPPAVAQEAADLAKQLSNPVADLVSVPFQFNYDGSYGPQDGDRAFVNVQPVIPFGVSEDWNVISRTILPVVWQDDVVRGSDQFGLGDTVQSLFLSPKTPTNGVVWGVGPVLLLPTATDDALGGEKFGLGPTGVALIQSGPWTYGALANHIWSVAGDGDRSAVNQSFVQPFIAYTTPGATTIALNTETTYDWQADAASVPVNLQVNQVVTVSGQTLQLGGGLRYWLDAPDGGPEGFGARLNFTLLFPR